MSARLRTYAGALLTAALLAAIIVLRTRLAAVNFHPNNSNFTTYWLAGRMLISGENPYDAAQFLAENNANAIAWHPNAIFHYPLPLAILCIPFGVFTLSQAYLILVVLSQLIVAVVIFELLREWKSAAVSRLFIPLFAAIVFFGPLYLTLETGTLGALTLLYIFLAVRCLESNRAIAAGLLLSLLMLKPSQGITILLLLGIWLLANRNWKALIGMALGGIILLSAGWMLDPHWIAKFREVSSALLDRTQGTQSNVWSFAYLACGHASPCAELLGGTLSLVLLSIGGFALWRNRAAWSSLKAVNFILPLGFVATVYLWAYDQIVYVIPIAWILAALTARTKSYLPAVGFLLFVCAYSFFALAMQARSGRDLWSLGTSLIVAAVLVALQFTKAESRPASA